MSRSSAPETPSTARTHRFAFRSRTAPLESASSNSSANKEPSKPKKLNSLLWFNREPDHKNTSDYNQQSQPLTSGHDRFGPGSNSSLRVDVDDNDDDDDSDNGTVLPGQGHYTLRVINPDPVSSSESEEEDEEEEDEKEQEKEKGEKHKEPERHPSSKGKNPVLTVTNHGQSRPQIPPPHESATTTNNNSNATPFVSSFLSTEISPTVSSLSLNSSSSNVGSSLPSSAAAKVELVRRQSKIELQESPSWLPPLDLPPLDWTIPVQGATKASAPPVTNRAALEPAPSVVSHEEREPVTIVASPLTLTPVTESAPEDRLSRASAGSASHLGERLSPSSPSVANSGIVPSSVFGNRSVASTAKESILTSTMTRNAKHSKYSKASYSLTNNPRALKQYREMAEKTNSADVQLTYAKYLLEIAELYDASGKRQQQHARSSSTTTALLGNGTHRRRDPQSVDARLLDVLKRGRTSLQLPMRNLKIDESDNNERKKRALEEEGVRWIKRLAKQECGEAAYLLATMYEQEKYGLRRQPLKSFKLYEIAARAKIPEAMHAAAAFHESQGNASEAVVYYKAAAELGLVDSVHRMAQVYLHGELGQRQNMTTGLDVLAQAAENATETCPEPLFIFGQVLANIYPRADIPAELVQAYGGAPACIKYFERAAEYGHVGAQSQIGAIYEYGLFGAPVNLQKSFEWYEKAAQREDARAMLGLSRLYNGGTHYPDDMAEQDRLMRDISGWTERNEDLSFSWCDKAAEKGDDEALFVMGRFYEYGFGTPRDLVRSQSYYRQAALKGNKDAIELLKRNNSKPRSQQQKDRESSRRDSTSTCVVM